MLPDFRKHLDENINFNSNNTIWVVLMFNLKTTINTKLLWQLSHKIFFELGRIFLQPKYLKDKMVKIKTIKSIWMMLVCYFKTIYTKNVIIFLTFKIWGSYFVFRKLWANMSIWKLVKLYASINIWRNGKVQNN